MNGGRPSQRNDWLSPGTLLQIVAMAALTLSSYWSFRQADAEKIAQLDKDVAVLTQRVAQLEKSRHP